jgi:hypothetical protein
MITEVRLIKRDYGYNLVIGAKNKVIATTNQVLIKQNKLQELSEVNCDEIFGIVDVELNKNKLFSEADMRKAYGIGFSQHGLKSFYSFIESIQQTERDVEIETIQYGLGNDEDGRPVFETRNLLDENECLILKIK